MRVLLSGATCTVSVSPYPRLIKQMYFLLTGLSIHTFHGNFFVRSTDLLSLPNISPDAGFGVQVSIEDTLDMNYVSFQAALLYTSSKGERLTISLPCYKAEVAGYVSSCSPCIAYSRNIWP